MSVFQVRSANPKLGYLIGKKPPADDGSGVRMKAAALRDGRLFGWFTHLADGKKVDPCEYNIFIEGVDYSRVNSLHQRHNKSSDNVGAYVNASEYSSPYAWLDCLGELLATKANPDDVPAKHSFEACLTHVAGQQSAIERYSKLLSFEASFDNGGCPSGYSAVTLSTENRSLCDLLSFAYVVGLMLVLTVERPNALAPGMFDHGVRLLKHLRAPYTIVRQFTTRAVRSEKLFQTYRAQLQDMLSEEGKGDVEIRFGNSQQQRVSFVSKLLAPFERDIVDCGCGAGSYAIPFGKKMKPGQRYHAIDVDEKELDKLKEKAAKKLETSPIVTHNSMDAFYKIYDNSGEAVDVIVTEMVEHLEPDDAAKFLTRLLKTVRFRGIVVTTPDAEFNPFLQMSTKFRHHDHKVELTKTQFQNLVHKCIKEAAAHAAVSFHAVGDRIGPHSVSQAAVITAKE